MNAQESLALSKKIFDNQEMFLGFCGISTDETITGFTDWPTKILLDTTDDRGTEADYTIDRWTVDQFVKHLENPCR